MSLQDAFSSKKSSSTLDVISTTAGFALAGATKTYTTFNVLDPTSMNIGLNDKIFARTTMKLTGIESGKDATVSITVDGTLAAQKTYTDADNGTIQNLIYNVDPGSEVELKIENTNASANVAFEYVRTLIQPGSVSPQFC